MEEEEREFSLEGPSKSLKSRRPLAERLRPLSLNEVRGQEHILGEGCLLPSLIRENRVGNLIWPALRVREKRLWHGDRR